MGRAVLVDYRRLYKLEQFENERIGIALEVDPGEDSAVVFEQARAWVEAERDRLEAERQSKADQWQEVSHLQRQRDTLAYEVRMIERARVELLKHADQLIAVLSLHGVNVSDVQASINFAPLAVGEIADGDEEEDQEDQEDQEGLEVTHQR